MAFKYSEMYPKCPKVIFLVGYLKHKDGLFKNREKLLYSVVFGGPFGSTLEYIIIGGPILIDSMVESGYFGSTLEYSHSRTNVDRFNK